MWETVEDKADALTLAALLALSLTTVAYVSLRPESLGENLAALCAALAVTGLTRDASRRARALCGGALTACAAVWLFTHLAAATPAARGEGAFWLMALTCLPRLCWRLGDRRRALERENALLRRRLERASLVDEGTGLASLRAYEKDMPRLRPLAGRQGARLTLIVWALNETGISYTPPQKREIHRLVTEASAACFQRDNAAYLLRREPALWGALVLARRGDDRALQQNLLDKMDSIDFSGLALRRQARPRLKIGVAYAGPETVSARALLEDATHSMNADVLYRCG